LLIVSPGWASAIGCLLTAVLLSGGCGVRGAAAVTPVAPTASVEVTLTEFKFTPNPIEALVGATTFRLTNEGQAGHDFTIVSTDGHHRLAHSGLIAPGMGATLTTTLRVGTYPVICTQPGHQEAGMEAVLQVLPAK